MNSWVDGGNLNAASVKFVGLAKQTSQFGFEPFKAAFCPTQSGLGEVVAAQGATALDQGGRGHLGARAWPKGKQRPFRLSSLGCC